MRATQNAFFTKLLRVCLRVVDFLTISTTTVLSNHLVSGRDSLGSDGRRMTRYLVDPASSHMLVSKIKPCMSKNKPQNGESANGSLNQLLFI